MSATNKLVRMGDPAGEGCDIINEAVALIGDKWTVMVLGALNRHERLRYTELQRVVGGISQRMLTLRLKTLEENGLVKRTVFPTVPPRVDYEVTPLGRTFLPPLRAIVAWTKDNRQAMAEARRSYARNAKTES